MIKIILLNNKIYQTDSFDWFVALKLIEIKEDLQKAKIMLQDDIVFCCGVKMFDEIPYGYHIIAGTQNIMKYGGSLNEFVDYATTKDVRWTKERNKGLTGEFFSKYRFRKVFLDIAIPEIENTIASIDNIMWDYEQEVAAKEEAFEKERSILLDGVKWNRTESIIHDEGGKTKYFTHHITINSNTYVLTERNVFDFGRVINFKDGCIVKRNGVFVVNTFDGKDIALTDDEVKAVTIVKKYGGFANSHIRM
ncbi:MAG: hypothetical protein IJ192_10875 [Clostridia bacterium]|nr:hypothetical protein [Clostridia bacterium]